MASSSRVERRLSAIFSADMVGYSRLMEVDEEDIVSRQKQHLDELIKPAFTEFGGRVVKFMGDGMLVEFPSAVDAVQCAVKIQNEMRSREKNVPEERQIVYRVGINLGDIIIDGDDILGDGVNIAARIEGLTPPGSICIAETVQQSISSKSGFTFIDLGDQKVKNISRPIRVFEVVLENSGTANPTRTATATNSKRHDTPSIAVLAFNNMSGDPEQEYFSDGISEDIITGLSYIKDLLVIARNSSFTYKDQKVDVKKVGKELGVRYVLEGSVRRGGDQVRVTGQLIDTETGGHVWADKYDGKLDDIFELQDDITSKVLTAIGTEITLAEIKRSGRRRPEAIDAWDHYLQALPLYYQIDKEGYDKSKPLLQKAIELDANFSSAHALLANCYIQSAFHGWDDSAHVSVGFAEAEALKALSLDDGDPFAHVALGNCYMFTTQPAKAIPELNRALDLNPNIAVAHGRLSNCLAFMGRTDEAIEAAYRAERGSPRDPEAYLWRIGIMNAHFAAENYRECVEAGEQAILLKPNFYGAHTIIAAALPYLNRHEDAKREIETLLKLMPRMSLRNTARNPMFTRKTDVDRLLEGLKQAGLPE